MTAAVPTLRPAIAGDIEAEHAVFLRAEGELRRRHGFAWTEPPLPWFLSIARHLLETDPGRCHVAEVGGRVVGFSAAFVRDDAWFLAALFIDPDHQGQGLGRRLFELAARDAPRRRITITDAIQPVSNALYAGYGLIPTTPVLLYEGEPSGRAPTTLDADRPREGELAMLDRAGYGFDRSVDHEHWQRQRRCTVWRRDGRAVAYSYRSLTGSIGPLAAIDMSAAAGALAAELALVRRASVILPGSARGLVEVAVAAGLRLVPPPGLLLLSTEAPPPTALAISNYFVY